MGRVPRGNADGKTAYPVAYLTDGDDFINAVGAVTDFLAKIGRAPELILVGIPHTDRTRDLTPTHVETADDGINVWQTKSSGGADKFLQFIETELMPEVEKRYRTQPFRVLAGHSLGGLFAVHALSTRPGLFNVYVAVSPSLWWDGQSEVNRFEGFIAKQKRL